MAYVDKINKENVDYDIQDSKAARSVDGTTASHVEEANQIYTTSGVAQTEYFIYRTTAGDASINTGPASIVKLIGHTEQTGHTDEVLTAVGAFTEPGVVLSFDKPTFRTKVTTNGEYIFTYGVHSGVTGWALDNTVVDISEYGLSISGGQLTTGDRITVNYTQLVVGTLTTATPTSFVSTGYNQYDATAGYAHVIGDNQYRIAGTYTSLGFTTTVGGTTTAVTVTNGKFTPTEDGYIYVTGASGNILIALVWSGVRDSDPFEAYETDVVTVPTADASSAALPTASYGMPSVGDVADELSFSEKKYYQRIGHYAYSPANLATVEALGVPYIWDNSDIFYVLNDPVEYTLASTVDGAYTANDFGTEEFTGTSATVGVSLYYGNNLVDKLRNLADIQTIGTGLTLTNGELASSGGGGSNYKIYSTISTSDRANGGAVYLGNLNASQEQQQDPATTDYHGKYFWALPYSNTNNPQWYGGSINIMGSVTGSSGVCVGNESYVYGNNGVAIGVTAKSGQQSVAIGHSANAAITGSNISAMIAIGNNAYSGDASYSMQLGANTGSGYGVQNSGSTGSIGIGKNIRIGSYQNGYKNAIALGSYSSATHQGEINVGLVTGETTSGYNGTAYRLISGVHDGADAHDVATVAQGNTLSTSAPDTSTVGVLGQLWTDTTNMHTYQCTAISGDTYTWTQRW